MKCPKCDELIFDIYTTEDRIRDMYKMNNTVGWAKERIRILIEMMEDRQKPDYPLPPVKPEWVIDNLKKIQSGLKSLCDYEKKGGE